MDAPIKVLNLGLEYLSFKPEIDLFATNINTQFGKYASFRPDPGAMYIDAFSIDWFNLKFYAFPPISIIPRVLAKVKQDSEEGIIVVPFWPTQVWYPAMLKMLVSTQILLNSRKSLLVQRQTNQPGRSNVEKDVHVGGPFVRLFAESKSFSRDALENLSVSWRVGTGKR